MGNTFQFEQKTVLPVPSGTCNALVMPAEACHMPNNDAHGDERQDIPLRWLACFQRGNSTISKI